MAKSKDAVSAPAEPRSASDVLNSISLEQIDAELAELEKKKGDLQNQIDGLKACRKVIDIRLNGKQKRGWSDEQRKKAAATREAKKAAGSGRPASAGASFAPVSAPTVEMNLVEKITRYLMRQESAKPYIIAQNVSAASSEVLRLLQKYNDRFVLDPTDDKWSLRTR